MLTRDVRTVLLSVDFFVFAVQPPDHTHIPRRREADNTTTTPEAAPELRRTARYEAEAVEDASRQAAFFVSR